MIHKNDHGKNDNKKMMTEKNDNIKMTMEKIIT